MENKYTILIVDDSVSLLKKLSLMISRNIGANVVEANSGREAITKLGYEDIDIIMLDIFMPELDGFGTAKLIRSLPKTKDIPIIFMTASDPDKELMDQGLEIGAVDYLTKPFSEQQLVKIISLYFRFIDHQKEVNARLVEMNTQLENEIKIRIKIEDALKKSKVELKQINASKDKFFSLIAHDLKNPLGAFKQVTEILADSFEQLSLKEIISFIQEMKKASINLYNLLENLLMWASSQTGKISYNPDNVQINHLVKNVLSLYEASAKNKELELVNDTDPEVFVFVDYNMVHTVIRNIVSNAIKFTPIGGKIKISGRQTDEGVLVSIADTGVGISKEVQEKMFRIDEHISTKGTSDEDGTGLGLILCQEFVMRHGGRLWLESEEGKGTIFYFTLLSDED